MWTWNVYKRKILIIWTKRGVKGINTEEKGVGGGLKFLDTRTAPEQLMTKSLNKFSQEGVENCAFIERRLLKTFTEWDVYCFYRFRSKNWILCFDIVYIVNFAIPKNTGVLRK